MNTQGPFCDGCKKQTWATQRTASIWKPGQWLCDSCWEKYWCERDEHTDDCPHSESEEPKWKKVLNRANEN